MYCRTALFPEESKNMSILKLKKLSSNTFPPVFLNTNDFYIERNFMKIITFFQIYFRKPKGLVEKSERIILLL